ncbi:hypothetical protein D0T49_05595 [Paludibacter sp. 221]|uniref:hypothetical protein n=1 Tax=Paludibacter sp. 221 TaxID=2302939 RepID=UPI0013D54D69|nr:hypothetical protein [Paludibacter sp. 221]NDV46515.1 hypothetical protein [Paludibacter sp. 221]
MKKVFLTIAVIACVGAFSSCKKECTCKSYVAGEEIASTIVDKEKGKCSDMNESSTILGITAELKCK